MKFETKLRFLLYKYYFDKGFSLTNNLKYIIGLFALYDIVRLENDMTLTIVLGGTWALLSFFLGWWWYRKDWNAAEIEIGNRINPFVHEVRRKLKVSSKNKKFK